MCISAFRPSSGPFNSLVILFIHSAFLFCFWLPYFSSKSLDFFCIIIIYSLEFFTSVTSDDFSLYFERQQVPSSLQDSSQYSVVWMVSIRLPTSKSTSPFSNLFVTVPKTPITIGIMVICMFHSFFNSLARSRYLSFFSHSFSFILWSPGTAKLTILQVLFFFCCC